MLNKIISLICHRYLLYIDILEFIFLFLILFLTLHYINKLIKLPRLLILFITIDLFLIFPKFTINTLKFIIRSFFYLLIQLILLIIKLFKFSRLEFIIIINVILIGILLLKLWQKKRNRSVTEARRIKNLKIQNSKILE